MWEVVVNPSDRSLLAVAICAVSAVLAAVGIVLGAPPFTAIILLAAVWHFTAEWSGGRLWLLFATPKGIFQRVRGGLLLPPLSRNIRRGSWVLLLAAVVWKVGPWK
jgi:hypothetical protein